MNRVLEIEAFLKDLRPNRGIAKRKRRTARRSGEIVDEVTQATEPATASKRERTARIEGNFVAHDDTRYITSNLESLSSFHQAVRILELVGRMSTTLRQSGIYAQK